MHDVTGLPSPVCAALFAVVLTGTIWAASPRVMDQINTALVLLVVASFLARALLQPPQKDN